MKGLNLIGITIIYTKWVTVFHNVFMGVNVFMDLTMFHTYDQILDVFTCMPRGYQFDKCIVYVFCILYSFNKCVGYEV